MFFPIVFIYFSENHLKMQIVQVRTVSRIKTPIWIRIISFDSLDLALDKSGRWRYGILNCRVTIFVFIDFGISCAFIRTIPGLVLRTALC